MADCPGCGAALVSDANFCFKCGRKVEAQAPSDPLLGRTLGSYRVLSALGQGAMGRVYRAEQVSLGRAVCIKTLLPHLSSNPTLVGRFEREARSVSGLHHPNVVGVYDFGRTPEGLLYIVMELVEGRSLRAVLLQDWPLPAARALDVTEQILSGLAEAHALGVVHRDLKPENVLVGRLRDGRDLVKVVDFGIAKLVGEGAEGEKLTGTGMVCGTPGYMAPEQIVGEPLDARVDVYAAGVVLFELLTGVPPFPGNNPQELLRAALTGVPPSPSKVSKLPLSPALDGLVLKALANDRTRRFASALEFKRAIEVLRASQRQGTQSAAPAPRPPVRPEAGIGLPCPACGYLETSGRKFCGECGASMSTGASSTPSAVVQGVPTGGSLDSFKQLMPQKLLAHMEELSGLMAGERRRVTVLFGDLSGFTSMSERMDPEEVREVMNRCFDGMVEAVNRYDGTVDKFIGDCIMVLFGAPKAHEDDPLRAVRCALEMQRYLAEVNKTLGRPLGFRIGINTGEVIAGGVGGHSRMDYTVMGDVVNTAQRLESNARVGRILVSAAVRDFAASAVEFRALDPIKLKGKAEPLPVFEVVGRREEREVEGASGRLVGRDTELGALRAALDAARGGKGAAVLLLGEGGMGKSRLLREVGSRAAALGMRVCAARAGRFGTPVPLELLREAVFGLCGGPPRAPNEADQRLGELTSLGLAMQDLARLRHLFGSAPALPGFERDESQKLDRAVVLEAFARASEPKGLCLLLDDLHLADAASLELLEALRARLSAGRLAIVGSARPGDTTRLLLNAPRLELARLDRASVLDLARAELGGAEVPPDAVELIAQRAEGNPLFTREVVRSLIEGGGLQLAGGTWRSTASLADVRLPETLQLLLGARLDALSQPARVALRHAAVAGRVFNLELVAATLDPGVDLAAAMEECVNRGFVAPSERAGCLQFAQAVAHEAVLGQVMKADRRHLHLRLAEALEQGVGADGSMELMARHFLAADQLRKGIRYLALAAEQLAERSDHAGAADRFRHALSLATREAAKGGAPGPEVAAQLLSLAAQACAAQQVLGPEAALALVDPVLALVPADRARPQRAEALRQRGLALLKLSRASEALESLQEALALAAAEQQPAVLAALRADVAAAHETRGAFEEAVRELTEGLHAVAGAPGAEKDLMWRYLNQLGRLHLRLEKPQRAREFFENARAQAQRAGSALGESRALLNLAATVSAMGDPRAALPLTVEALEKAERAGDRIGVARIHYNAGRLLVASGQRDEGLARLRLALEQSHRLGWREGIAAASQALEALRPRAPI